MNINILARPKWKFSIFLLLSSLPSFPSFSPIRWPQSIPLPPLKTNGEEKNDETLQKRNLESQFMIERHVYHSYKNLIDVFPLRYEASWALTIEVKETITALIKYVFFFLFASLFLRILMKKLICISITIPGYVFVCVYPIAVEGDFVSEIRKSQAFENIERGKTSHWKTPKTLWHSGHITS